MDVGAAEFLGRDLLAGRRLHERRAAEEDRAGALDDDRLVRHRRHVGAAGRAGAHDDGHLRDALGRHARLVEEDAAEVVPVGEDVGLQRQERAARVDEVHARQAVLERDLLRAHVLLHGDREVRAALDRGVVGDDQHLAPRHAADARHEPGARAPRRRTGRRPPAATARGTASPDRGGGRCVRDTKQLALLAVPPQVARAAALRARASRSSSSPTRAARRSRLVRNSSLSGWMRVSMTSIRWRKAVGGGVTTRSSRS